MPHSRRRFMQASAINAAMLAASGSATHASQGQRLAPALELDNQHPTAFKRLSNRSRRALRFAFDEATEAGHGAVSSNLLLIGLAAEAEYSGARWLSNLGLTLDDICTVVDRIHSAPRSAPGAIARLQISPEVRKSVVDGIAEASLMGYQKAEPEHLLLGILQNPHSEANRVLHEMWIEAATVEAEAVASLPTWGSVHHRFG